MSRARDIANNWAADITGVTAGTGITGGGTSGAVTVTNDMATTIDAKGDLVVGSGADTYVRVAVGSNNEVLTADSATTSGVKWANAVASVSGTAGRITVTGTGTPTIDLATSGVTAGTYGSSTTIPQLAVDAYGRITSISNAGLTASSAMTLIGSQTVSSGNITFGSIPTHKSLVAHVNAVASGNSPLGMQVNGVTSNSYVSNGIGWQSGAPGIILFNPNGGSIPSQAGDTWRSGRFFVNGATYSQVITFPNSGASRTFKTFFAHGSYDGNAGVVTPYLSNGILTLGSAGAITTITFFVSAGGSSQIDLYAMN